MLDVLKTEVFSRTLTEMTLQYRDLVVAATSLSRAANKMKESKADQTVGQLALVILEANNR